jgi:hypothetical protein
MNDKKSRQHSSLDPDQYQGHSSTFEPELDRKVYVSRLSHVESDQFMSQTHGDFGRKQLIKDEQKRFSETIKILKTAISKFDNPRHSCAQLVLNYDCMKSTLTDNRAKPKLIRPYNTVNVEKHDGGIKRHSSMDTIKNHVFKCDVNKTLKFTEIHERHFEIRNSSPRVKPIPLTTKAG